MGAVLRPGCLCRSLGSGPGGRCGRPGRALLVVLGPPTWPPEDLLQLAAGGVALVGVWLPLGSQEGQLNVVLCLRHEEIGLCGLVLLPPKPRSPVLTLGSILLPSRTGLRSRLLSGLDTPRPRGTRAALLRRLEDRHGVLGLGLPRVWGGGVWQGRAGRVAGAPTAEPEVGVAQTPVQGGPSVMGPGPCVPTPRAPAAGPWPLRHRCRLPAEGPHGQTSVWFSEE